jgi:hypothetical protein
VGIGGAEIRGRGSDSTDPGKEGSEKKLIGRVGRKTGPVMYNRKTLIDSGPSDKKEVIWTLQ